MDAIVQTLIKSRRVEGINKPLLIAALDAISQSYKHHSFDTDAQSITSDERCFLLRYEAICDSSSAEFVDSTALAKVWADHHIAALTYCENINAIGGRLSAIKAVSNIVIRINNQDKPYYTYKQIEDALYNNKGASKSDIQQLLVAAVIDKVAQAGKGA